MTQPRYVLVILLAIAAFAQQKPGIVGDFAGTLGRLHVKLHITAGTDGALAGTLDSSDQGAMGIPCANILLDGQALSFNVPAVGGSWKGSVSGDGKSLTGTWNQGAPTPLTFTRDTFVPSETPSSVDGIWLGTVSGLRAQIKVKSDKTGREFCTFDSLDQRALDWECANVTTADGALSFDVPFVHGHWSGKLSADGKTLAGTWKQGTEYPLNFAKQTSAQTVTAPALDPAMDPVDLSNLEAVLNRDLEHARSPVLKVGPLAPGTDAGIVVGVSKHGMRRILTYGTAKPDSIFEIGSITKTFTALILARMVEQGKVKFDDPVRELLPPGTVAKLAGAEITLLDLATQHSGLPRMPDNFKPADRTNPYADYRPANLYEFLAKHGVAKPEAPRFLYSNLGVGLLGQALAERAGMTYPNLLKEQVIGPLGMKDAAVLLSPTQQGRFIQGHDGEHHPVHSWELDALAGAGAIRSTAADMLTYLEAQLHPEKAGALSGAISQTHELRADAAPGMRIGLAWLYITETGNYWHNGGTGGYSSFALFNPKDDYAVVVLFNTSGNFPDLVGGHIAQRLAGKPAVALGN